MKKMVLNSPYGYFTTPYGERIPNGVVCEVDNFPTRPFAKFPAGVGAIQIEHPMAIPGHWLTPQ